MSKINLSTERKRILDGTLLKSSIHSETEKLTKFELIELKSYAITKKLKRKKYTKKIDIEIVNFEMIDGGVAVYARAWTHSAMPVFKEVKVGNQWVKMQIRVIPAGTQIGFGSTGTVDIERFQVFNPPVLVPDENGDIVIEKIDEATQELNRSVYREDAEVAILEEIQHTISVKSEKFGSENIIKGSIGNTTSTFYPSSDGRVYRGVVSETFSAIRAGAGQVIATSGTNYAHAWLSSAATTDRYRVLARNGYVFDTSSIPDTDDVSNAVLSFMSSASNTLLGDTDVDIVSYSPASDTNIATGDYASGFGTTRYATGIAITAHTHETYTDFTLNATGIAAISKTGNSRFGVRCKWDVDDNFTGSWVSGNDKNTNVSYYQSENTGTTKDPKLVVEHAAAGGANYEQDLFATITVTAGVSRSMGRSFTESLALNASFVRAMSRTIIATLTLVATVKKTTSRTLDETLALVASVKGVANKYLTATLTATASVVRSTSRTLSATVTMTASIAKITARSLSATVTLVSSVVKQTTRSLTETITTTATRTSAMGRTLAETLSVNATVTKATNKAQNAVLTLTASVQSAFGKTLTETMVMTASVAKNTSRFVTESLTLVATVRKGSFKAFSETITATAIVARHTARRFTETLTATASIARTMAKRFTETITATAGLRKDTTRRLSVTMTMTATIRKATTRLFTETMTLTSSLVSDLISLTTRVGTTILKSAKDNVTHLLSKRGDASVLQSKREDAIELKSKDQ